MFLLYFNIEIPYEFVFGSPGRNATLSCHITGSPPPTTRWVVDGRIVNNNTSPVPFDDQKWILQEETYGIQKWFNLTVTYAQYTNLGKYVCVAENEGGVMEKTVTLTFDDPASISHGNFGLTSEQWTVVIGAVTASLVFLALIIAFICFCCFCRKNVKKQDPQRKKGSMGSYPHSDIADQSHQRLLPPTPMQENHTSMVMGHFQDQMRTPSVISKPQSCTPTTHSGSSRASIENYDPDLIHHYKKTSTPLSVSSLQHQIHPSGNGTLPHRSSNFTRSGTLPIHYHHHHHHHPRSVSCDHTSQTLRLPPKQPKHSLQHPVLQQQQQQQQHQRPGYVTLPRKPRSSWSAPPRESPTPSMYSMTMTRRPQGPVYDGVGPRTSADGSSLSTLPRGSSMSNGGIKVSMTSPVGSLCNGGKVSLGPYYAPIAELAECPSTPKEDKKQKLVNNNSASSEVTLMEESISSYCEPFGKALAPSVTPDNSGGSSAAITPTPLSSTASGGGLKSTSRHSTTSAESELEALIVPHNGQNGQNGHNGGYKLEEDIPPMMPLLPPIMTSTQGIAETSFNEEEEQMCSPNNNSRQSAKVPPKTLPKPKVRPLPPPKPSKSSMLNHRPVMFQDEGADGSEV